MSYGKNFRDLFPHEQKAVAALDAAGYKAKRTQANEFRCGCPVHGYDTDDDLSVYLNDKNVFFKCHSQGCSHKDILTKLGLDGNQVSATSLSSKASLTLKEYAEAKKLSSQKLIAAHVSTGRQPNGHQLEISYLDFDGQHIGLRKRRSMREGVHAVKGGSLQLYGQWRHEHIAGKGYVVIVEGESDCHTLWHHDEPAVGIPGATCVANVLPDLERLLELHSDLEVCVFQEPGEAGKAFVNSFQQASFSNQIGVVHLDGFKDASELHMHDDLTFKENWASALKTAVPLSIFLDENAPKSLADLSPRVRGLLNGKALKRPEKERLAEIIGDFLILHSRLLLDVSNDSDPLPYILTDNGSAVTLAKGVRDLIFALQDCGMNPSETIFGWTIDDLVHRASREGKQVKLEHYSVLKNNRLYASSGTTSIVIAELIDGKVSLRTSPNGTDEVLFAADACFPDWQVSAPVFLDDIAAFSPILEAPEEAPDYCPEYQRILFEAWMICRIAGFAAPILTSIGAMASGKSITQRAVVKMFMGAGKDVCNSPDSQRGFFSAATSFPVYMIDNLDKDPDHWFADTIASACTGVIETDRKLFKNSEVFSKPVTANFGITTRSAFFANRPDIQDRLLPLFYGILKDEKKEDETFLLNEVCHKRNGLLTQLVNRAARCLLNGDKTSGLPGRFQPFARIANSISPRGRSALNACEIAKRLSVVDCDPVTEAIHRWFREAGHNEMRGTAIEIGRIVRSVNPELPDLGGKTFARRLREVGKTLSALGYRLNEEKRSDGSTVFTISRR